MSTMSIDATAERPVTPPNRQSRLSRLRSIPWLTVLPLAVVMAYADGFWVTSLRGAVGAIERTQEPFASWLRESTLALPFYVAAVAIALRIAARLSGPVQRRARTVAATALLVVAAGTMVGIYEVATSSAYDYSLQSSQLQVMGAMNTSNHGSTGVQLARQQRATLGLQLRSVGYGSGILLVTNVILVGWVVALRGGRLRVSTRRG